MHVSSFPFAADPLGFTSAGGQGGSEQGVHLCFFPVGLTHQYYSKESSFPGLF